MAKKRPKISTISTQDALEIGKKVMQNTDNTSNNVSKQSNKDKSKRFNMRIPTPMFERLEKVSKEIGLSKSAILINGLHEILKEYER